MIFYLELELFKIALEIITEIWKKKLEVTNKIKKSYLHLIFLAFFFFFLNF